MDFVLMVLKSRGLWWSQENKEGLAVSLGEYGLPIYRIWFVATYSFLYFLICSLTSTHLLYIIYIGFTVKKHSISKSFVLNIIPTKFVLTLELISMMILFSALEEWRKRKMERARQRELEKNGTTSHAWLYIFSDIKWRLTCKFKYIMGQQ